MRVLLNISPVLYEAGGMGWYTRQLLQGLGRTDQENTYLLYAFFLRNRKERLRRVPAAPAANFRVCIAPRAGMLLQSLARMARLPLPLSWFTARHDIYHSTSGMEAMFCRSPARILTVHDVIALDHPEWFPVGVPETIRTNLIRNLGGSLAVITGSRSTRKDLARHFPSLAPRLFVCPYGVDGRFSRMEDPGRLFRCKKELSLPDRYVLCTGRLEKRKNLITLIEAFARIAGKERDLHLVLVGEPGFGFEQIESAREGSGVRDRIRIFGYSSEADLNVLYNGAELFVCPSLYEGFGLPPLEAMLCGTPVIVADRGSLPEVVGDAALIVDAPESSEKLADAMRRMLGTPSLRQEYTRRGLARAAAYSWERHALEVQEIYRTVYSEKQRMSAAS